MHRPWRPHGNGTLTPTRAAVRTDRGIPKTAA
jgi:hypothetical protein